MKHYGMKVALFAALVMVCVFFGIDIATSGMERIAGPTATRDADRITPTATPSAAASNVAETSAAAQAAAGQSSAATSAGAAQASPAAAVQGAVVAAEPEAGLVNRAVIGLGDGLRYLAQGLIRFVVDLFGALLG